MQEPQLPSDVTNALSALGEVLYGRATYEEVFAAVARLAVEVVPGCDHAALSVLDAGGEMTVHGPTSPVAALIDELESQLREGPCYDAIVSNAFQMDADMTQDATWPELGRKILELTPVRGMLGFRVQVGARKGGALNIFSDTPGALNEESIRIGTLIAAFASVALGASAERELAETLRAGLLSNREIGKAIGIIMATHGVTDEEAFQVMRKASQDLNIKLGRIARQVIDEQLRSNAAGAKGLDGGE